MNTTLLIVALAAPPLTSREAAPVEPLSPLSGPTSTSSPSTSSSTSSSSTSAPATASSSSTASSATSQTTSSSTTSTSSTSPPSAGSVEAAAPPEADPGAPVRSTPASPPTTSEAPAAPPLPPPEPPIRPLRWRLDLGPGVGLALHLDPAWRAFDPDDRRVAAVDIGLRGDLRLGGRAFLGVGAAYRQFSGRGDLDQVYSTRLLAREALVALRVSAVMVEGVDLFGQVDGGPSFVDFQLTGSPSGGGKTITGVVDGLGGVALYLPRRWLPRRGASRVSAGVEVIAGYSFRPAIDVDAALQADEEPIEAAPAHFGDLAMRGFVTRIGIFLRVF
ncbi:MAG: hypothetical protein R3B09_00700 [Nannocystaceae bacterium]